MRRRLQVGGGVALALVLVVGVLVGLHLWRRVHESPLEQALGYAPKDAERYGFTDWSMLAGSAGSSGSSGGDATTTSALVDLGSTLQASYGFGTGDLSWELLVGSPDSRTAGQVDLLRFPDGYDVGGLAGTLRGLGYTAPPDPGGVWDGSAAEAASASPILSAIALDPGRHLMLLSDDAAYLSGVVDQLGSSPDLPDGVAQAADAVGSPVSAQVFSGSYLCGALSLGHSDPTTEAQGHQLIAQAGKLNPVLGFALAEQTDRTVTVAMTFADHGQASTNADTRAKLAVGPAIGQSEGGFGEMFSLGRVAADGSVVTMRLTPVEDELYADLLSGGPILFASC
jgi:hypothetical protein